MKQRYNELTHELCVRAVLDALDGKWKRRDIMTMVNKYGGVRYEEIVDALKNGCVWPMLEAAEAATASPAGMPQPGHGRVPGTSDIHHYAKTDIHLMSPCLPAGGHRPGTPPPRETQTCPAGAILLGRF